MRMVSEMIEYTSLKHTNLINKIAAPLQTHFGIHYFCYQFVSDDGYWFTLGNHPEWLQYSAENAFYRHDPSLVCANRYSECAHLVSAHQHDSFQQTLIAHAVEKFEIDNGLMLIKPNLKGCAHYFFAAPCQHVHVMNTYISHFSRFNHDFTRYVQEQISPIQAQLMESAVDLKVVNPERFYSTDNLLNIDTDLSNGLSFSNEINTSPILTTRESQCLALYRQGFTAKQTAKQLGLSFRTIEDHIEKIKLKYDVQSKQALLFIP
jgi:DNA-binding CsgD family transcriptional regulator